jgi:uncharacterized membrane protein YtjA (UPF0391 family)
MIRWAIAFAVLALIAAVLGFGGLAGDFAYFAKILLFVFLVLFVISLIFGRGSPPAAVESSRPGRWPGTAGPRIDRWTGTAQASFASRIPENCQRASGGKKLR